MLVVLFGDIFEDICIVWGPFFYCYFECFDQFSICNKKNFPEKLVKKLLRCTAAMSK